MVFFPQISSDVLWGPGSTEGLLLKMRQSRKLKQLDMLFCNHCHCPPTMAHIGKALFLLWIHFGAALWGLFLPAPGAQVSVPHVLGAVNLNPGYMPQVHEELYLFI